MSRFAIPLILILKIIFIEDLETKNPKQSNKKFKWKIKIKKKPIKKDQNSFQIVKLKKWIQVKKAKAFKVKYLD